MGERAPVSDDVSVSVMGERAPVADDVSVCVMGERALVLDDGTFVALDPVGSQQVSQRHSRVSQRLDERHRQRELAISQRRCDDDDSALTADGGMDLFWTALDEQAVAMETALQRLDGEQDRAALAEGLDEASRCLQEARRLIADSVQLLPRYQLKRAQQRVQQLQELLQRRQEQLVPRKKFGFRNKQRAGNSTQTTGPLKQPVADGDQRGGSGSVDAVTDEGGSVDAVTDGGGSDSVDAVTDGGRSGSVDELALRDRQGELLHLCGDRVRGRQVVLAGLSDCRVVVTGCPNTVHLSALRDCRVLLGPTCSSVFLDDCSGCQLAAACQQLRVRDSRHCRLYMHVTSRAVVENSSDIGVAPYPVQLTQESPLCSDWTLSGLDVQRNNWQLVDDFDWLSKTHQSPNWRVLPPEQRTDAWHQLLLDANDLTL